MHDHTQRNTVHHGRPDPDPAACAGMGDGDDTMMRAVATPIPSGSHGLRLWQDHPPSSTEPEDGAPYSFACNLVRVSDDECELAQAVGAMSNAVVIQIGLAAIKLGYKRMTFRRAEGRFATRWAKYSHTADGMDHYSVDLVKALEIYKQRKS